MLLSVFSVVPDVTAASGWSYSINGTTLTISGSGKMTDYANYMGAPWYGKDIDKIVIGEGITHIGNYAFANLKNLNSVSFPSSLKTIGKNAFYNCRNLESIKLNDSLEKIDENAFYYCYGLESVEFGNSLKIIGKYAFAQCSALDNVVLPNSVTAIEENAFAYDYGLTYILIPSSVTDIGAGVFVSDSKVVIYCEKGSYAEQYAKDNSIPYKYITGSDVIEITVKTENGVNCGAGATVKLYNKNGSEIANGTTDSNGICKFNKTQYNGAETITAYKDTAHKGGPNRAAARDKFGNVIYSIRKTSDSITSSGKWKRESFNGKDLTLKMENPKLIFNCSVSYYYDKQEGDYYSDIVEAFKRVNQCLQKATDGYVELDKVAIYSTTDPNAFYRKSADVAKCDVQIRQYVSSDEWGSDVWPNAYVDGATDDDWYDYANEYFRVQMQKEAVGSDISTEPQTWAKIVTHELGHYLLGFYDEYLNDFDQQWSDIGRPTGAPDNYGLMEYQYTDLEMSVPADYINANKLSDKYKTSQYFNHEMSCWEYFDETFFDPNNLNAIIPTTEREYEEITNSVTFYDCRAKKSPSTRAVQTSNAVAQNNKDTSLFVMASFENEKLFLKTEEEIIKCSLSDFGHENIDDIELEKVTGGYQISLSEIDKTKNTLTVESKDSINVFDLYDVHLTNDKGLSNRNNSIMIESSSEQDCSAIIYTNNKEINDKELIGRAVALNLDNGSQVTLVGRTSFDGKIDYSTLSWFRYENDQWVKVSSESSVGEYSSLETSCNIYESGIYALIATYNTAEDSSAPSGQTFFKAVPFDSKDGGIKININFPNNDVIGYRVLCESKDKSETMKMVVWNTEVILKTDNVNKEYNIDAWAILNNGTEVSLGETQTVVSGEYCQDGSKIPFWWIVQYNLQEYEDQIVDALDYDGDGYTNYQEYINGTDPTVIDTPKPHTHYYNSEITTEPDCINTGIRTFVCNGCESVYTEVVPELGHAETDSEGNCLRCGAHIKDLCQQCGEEHTGFFGAIVAFFHRIIYKLTHLFG